MRWSILFIIEKDVLVPEASITGLTLSFIDILRMVTSVIMRAVILLRSWGAGCGWLGRSGTLSSWWSYHFAMGGRVQPSRRQRSDQSHVRESGRWRWRGKVWGPGKSRTYTQKNCQNRQEDAVQVQEICRNVKGRLGLKKNARCHVNSKKVRKNNEDLILFKYSKWWSGSPKPWRLLRFCQR